MWATDNPNEKLYFCVVRTNPTINTTLLEMELKQFFQELKAKNVTVLGLPSSVEKTMSELHKMMLSMPARSWMIDELFMPDPADHTKWAGELQMMRRHMASQPGHYLLWISIAGIYAAKPEHFKDNYLAPLMSGFHMAVMEFPLRNTKEVYQACRIGFKGCQQNSRCRLCKNQSLLLYATTHDCL